MVIMSDNEIQLIEAKNYNESIDINNSEIKSLEGIEFFYKSNKN